MKKALALLATLTVSLAACAGGNGASSDAGNSSSPMGEEMRVGLEGVFPPYSMHDKNGELTGFEVEIANHILENMDMKPTYIETKWDSLIAGLDANRYDMVINNIGITPERQQRYDLSIPYMNSTAVMAVAKDSDIKSPADLKGHTCASSATSNYNQMLKDAGANTIPVDGFNEAVKVVEQGRADCLANGTITLGYYFEQNPAAKDILRTMPFGSNEDAPVAIMLKKGSTEQLNAINEQIKKGLEDGSIEAAIAKYAGEEAAAASVESAKEAAGIQ